MASANKNWYAHLVAQSRTDDIYDLLHNYLPLNWQPGHDLDFVAVRKTALPDHLKNIPEKHLSKKLSQEEYCFPGDDYVLLHNYELTAYLYAAKWAKTIKDRAGREFIELRFDWTQEAIDCLHDPPGYRHLKPCEIPLAPREDSLKAAYELLQKHSNKALALEHARIGKSFLDAQHVKVDGVNDALRHLARRMTGYNIVAMVFVWNDKLNEAAAIDELYIFHPPLWDILSAHIKSYLEMLMAKRYQDYVGYLFEDMEFRQYFSSHYAAFVSLFLDDQSALPGGTEAAGIINRINNSFVHYQ